jgi:hypothetical protein
MIWIIAIVLILILGVVYITMRSKEIKIPNTQWENDKKYSVRLNDTIDLSADTESAPETEPSVSFTSVKYPEAEEKKYKKISKSKVAPPPAQKPRMSNPDDLV